MDTSRAATPDGTSVVLGEVEPPAVVLGVAEVAPVAETVAEVAPVAETVAEVAPVVATVGEAHLEQPNAIGQMSLPLVPSGICLSTFSA